MAISTGVAMGVRSGFEQSWMLSKEQFSLLDQHQMLVGVQDSYWEVMRRHPKEPLFEAYERGPFLVRIGKLTSYSITDVPYIVEGCYQSYLAQGTFGNFDTNNTAEEERLHAAMVSGFKPEQTLVSIVDEITGQVVGGTIVTPGLKNRRVADAVGMEDSMIPTFSSLLFNTERYGEFYEYESVGCSRFWRLPNDNLMKLIEKRDVNGKDYSRALIIEILSGMARASKEIMEHLGQQHKLSWFDTTDPGVLATVSLHYGAQVLHQETTPTISVKNSPLHWHFDMDSHIGVFEATTQYEYADKASAMLGPRAAVMYKD